MAEEHDTLVLDAAHIVRTLKKLHARIGERFPRSGLLRLCGKLEETGHLTAARVEALAKPLLPLRILGVLVAVLALVVQIIVASRIDWSAVARHADILAISQALDSTVNLLILGFGALLFMFTLERRLKRRQTLRALYELRSYAHVIDMHQLTKDPTVVLGAATSSSPERQMSEFELSRYLDYCSEMLALVAKLAALYAARTQDETIIEAVNDLEDLTSNLGRKIWQKIMIISQLDERREHRS
jgi:hypothetical protein